VAASARRHAVEARVVYSIRLSYLVDNIVKDLGERTHPSM
jgi:hypothetical protein